MQPIRSEGGALDVVICGGGLAGLTLARQLKRQMPDLAVVVLDKLSRPLPEAAFKVGEATVETATHYLCHVLGLNDYFDSTHIRKLGVRFFFRGDDDLPFSRRPELGLAEFADVKSFQIDRGMLENDLRRFIEDDGVELLEGLEVQDIELAADGAPHTVVYRQIDNGASGTLTARWVVDAMGRRRFLQRQLGLSVGEEAKCSAVWFRIDDRIDVASFVPESEEAWHQRVPGRNRYLSTNHLIGNGYWVWLIPLSSGSTSIGITMLEKVQPFAEVNTWERACDWIRRHEPLLAEQLEGREPMDFLCMRRYTYTTKRMFSSERWACVGEAGVFSDPFYALGSDAIGIANCFVTDMIHREREGSLSPQLVAGRNRFMLSFNSWLTHNIQGCYPLFGNETVITAKLIWDFGAGWGHYGPQMFNLTFLDESKESLFRKTTSRFFTLTLGMQRLFDAWGEKSRRRASFDFIDYLKIPLLRDIQLRCLASGKSDNELVADQQKNLEVLEELAQTLFLLAVEDVLPERLAEVESRGWLNAWALSLDPQAWESGLFEPRSRPRDLGVVRNQVRPLFRFA